MITDLEAVVQRCSVRKVFLEISQSSQENTCPRVSFFIKAGLRPVTLLKKRLCFLVNFVNIFFYRTSRVAASTDLRNWWQHYIPCWKNSEKTNKCLRRESKLALDYKSSPPDMFLGKDVLKICGTFTGEHPCRRVISIKLLYNLFSIYLTLTN